MKVYESIHNKSLVNYRVYFVFEDCCIGVGEADRHLKLDIGDNWFKANTNYRTRQPTKDDLQKYLELKLKGII